MNKIVTIIGWRKTPEEDLKLLEEISNIAQSNGYIVRTGDAGGADKAARDGCNNKKLLEAYKANDVNHQSIDVKKWLASRLKQFHPAPERLKSEFVRNLMMRNIFQIFSIEGVNNIVANRTLAKDTINSDFITDAVFCYTDKGKLVGGTYFAIRIAHYIGVPVYNLGNEVTKNHIAGLIKNNKNNFLKCFPKVIKEDDKLYYSFNFHGLDENELKTMKLLIPDSKNDVLIKGDKKNVPEIINLSGDELPEVKIQSKTSNEPSIYD